MLKTLADMGPKIVVPGHGDVGDVEIIKGVRDYMVDLEARVRSRQNEGKDIDAIISELRPQLLGEHPTWTGTEWIDYAVRYYVSTQA
ncbi:MAG: hypothetical protein E5V56_00215 [Mesorhizobium sp.]|nr:MAG: hypothetical protein E5V56_00215 [Mesorhizobium sp.]